MLQGFKKLYYMERSFNTVVNTTIFLVISGLYFGDSYFIISFFIHDHLIGGRCVDVFHDDIYHPPEADTLRGCAIGKNYCQSELTMSRKIKP